MKDAFERIAPMDENYSHNEKWGDGNGFSHIRAAILGPSLTIPFEDKVIELGTWQQIVLVDFDNRSRDRRDPLGRVPPGQGSSPGGDVGLPNEPDITRARKIAKQLYLKAEESLEGTVERRYVDSLLDWY